MSVEDVQAPIPVFRPPGNFSFGLSRPSRSSLAFKAPPPLFERIIYYMLAPEVFSRVVLEAGLNMYWYNLTQPKLWVFYGLMVIDYIFQIPTLGRSRFKLNLTSLIMFLLFVMALHGLVVGLAWGNNLPKVLTDTVPVLVTGINLLLLNREGELQGFSSKRLRTFVVLYCIIMVAIGTVAVSAGRLSVVSLGGSGGAPICLTILLVWLLRKPQISVIDVVILALIVGPTVPNTNRTTLAVYAIILFIFFVPRVLKSGKQLYFIGVLVTGLAIAFPLVVPPDSPIMRRIDAISEKLTGNKEEQSGSLYERQAEWAAINEKLHALGPNGQLFGYGAGGIYNVEFSGGRIPENYSHAHFSWALFRLRYGDIGFFYLSLFTLFIIANGIKMARRKDELSRIIFILDIWSFVHLFTYVFFNFLAAGLQFADLGPDRKLPASEQAGVQPSSGRRSKDFKNDG